MKSILTPLTNRVATGAFELPADGWYQLSPIGEFPVSLARDEKGVNGFGTKHTSAVQVLDQASITSLANSLGAGGEKLIDYDHESLDQTKRTTAAGWITNLNARDTGLWMAPRWSTGGQAAVSGGEYRYVSPVWNPDDCEVLGETADGSALRVRPLRLANAGLTNDPNLRGLAPLSNRAPAAPAQTKPTDKHTMKKCEHCGAPCGDDGKHIANRTDETATNAMKNRVTELEGQLAELDLDGLGIIDPKERETAKPLLISNRASALALMKNRTTKPAEPAKTPLTLQNRAKAPGAPAAAEDDDATRAQKCDAEVRQYKIANRCSYGAARNAVREAKPELFGLTTK